jgi:hypothetical protein
MPPSEEGLMEHVSAAHAATPQNNVATIDRNQVLFIGSPILVRK